MAKRRLFWDLYLSGLVLTLAALAAVAWYMLATLDRFYLEQVRNDLAVRANLVAASLDRIPEADRSAALQPFCQDLDRRAATRLTVIGADGSVKADSEHDPSTMDNHADRPEVAAALRGRTGDSTRFSATLRQRTMYVAVPVVQSGRVTEVVRAAIPVTASDALIHTLHGRLAAAALLAVVVVAGVILLVARRISRPLEQLRSTAERFAAGDLKARAATSQWVEMSALATAMNGMATALDDRIRMVIRQHNELETVLSGMTEGVVAVGKDERVLNFNAAAARMLGLDGARDRGRSLYEVVRSPDVQRLVLGVLQEGKSMEWSVEFDMGTPVNLRVRGSVLADAAGQRVGALLVFEDVTALRRLEAVRREFVANASHELKTPIAAIKGYVEALSDGAVEDPGQARQFLQVIAGQTERLESIVNDLLVLSRIEHEETGGGFALDMRPLAPVVQSAIQTCSAAAASRGVTVAVACDPALSARVNARLIEQALVNLIDNAIKFSEAGARVDVNVSADEQAVCLAVSDRGCGIAPEHLERIFERFYRVDKARSQETGGTGLGLAIVKHIVLLHNGRVTVQSAPGRGSTFAILLPPPRA